MAATGYTPIILFNSTSAGNQPTTSNLAVGELALNVPDGKLYYNKSGTITALDVSTISFGTTGLTPSTATSGVVTVAGTLVTTNGGTGLASYTAGDITYYSSGTALSKLAIGTANYVLTSSGTAPQWTASTGSGSVVLATSPTLVTPVLGTPSSGTLSSCTVDGTNSVGFRNIPINSQSAAYTTVLTDSGKVIFHPSTDANARTFTIDSNANVAYPTGTAITFINMTSQVVTIAITSDTMYLAGPGTTGSRSLAQYGMATAVKMTSTTWIISGNGVT
jgi:hypothetical protein